MEQKVRKLSAAEQMAGHLREGIRSGRWSGKLPGVLALAGECDVSPATMRAAIRLLERDGWIKGEGSGRARMVSVPETGQGGERRSLRVSILPGIRFLDEDAVFQRVLMQLQHDLDLAGHRCRVAGKSQQDLGHDAGRIARYVRQHPADAWVLIGPKHTVVEWFMDQGPPAICIGGQVMGKPIASTAMVTLEEFRRVVRKLVQLGHRRILFLWPDYRAEVEHDPYIDVLAQALADAGSEISSYNVPVWKSTPEGLREVLDKSFRFTPPTAIITTYGKWMAGVLSYLAARALRAPKDISLFSISEDDWFAWKEPQISSLRGDDQLMVRRIVRWVDAVERGRADKRFIGYPMHWVEGGTIGPAPKV